MMVRFHSVAMEQLRLSYAKQIISKHTFQIYEFSFFYGLLKSYNLFKI